MPKGPLPSSDFVATKFATGEDKAAFGNALLTFLLSDFQQQLFTQSLYNRLSLCFGHIAHYDRSGFYERWFRCSETRLEFVRHLLEAPCWGQAEFTFSDVERAIQREVRRLGLLPRLALAMAEDERVAAMKILAKLEAKYRTAAPPPEGHRTNSMEGSTLDELASCDRRPVQTSLF